MAAHPHYSNVIIPIKRLVGRDWNCIVQHVSHEENQSVNVLAKMGAESGDL